MITSINVQVRSIIEDAKELGIDIDESDLYAQYLLIFIQDLVKTLPKLEEIMNRLDVDPLA